MPKIFSSKSELLTYLSTLPKEELLNFAVEGMFSAAKVGSEAASFTSALNKNSNSMRETIKNLIQNGFRPFLLSLPPDKQEAKEAITVTVELVRLLSLLQAVDHNISLFLSSVFPSDGSPPFQLLSEEDFNDLEKESSPEGERIAKEVLQKLEELLKKKP